MSSSKDRGGETTIMVWGPDGVSGSNSGPYNPNLRPVDTDYRMEVTVNPDGSTTYRWVPKSPTDCDSFFIVRA